MCNLFLITFNFDLSSGLQLSGNLYFAWQFNFHAYFQLSITHRCRLDLDVSVWRPNQVRILVSFKMNTAESLVRRYCAHPWYLYWPFDVNCRLELLSIYTSLVYINRKTYCSQQIKPDRVVIV